MEYAGTRNSYRFELEDFISLGTSSSSRNLDTPVESSRRVMCNELFHFTRTDSFPLLQLLGLGYISVLPSGKVDSPMMISALSCFKSSLREWCHPPSQTSCRWTTILDMECELRWWSVAVLHRWVQSKTWRVLWYCLQIVYQSTHSTTDEDVWMWIEQQLQLWIVDRAKSQIAFFR